MKSTFWDRRAKKYDKAIKKRECRYEETIERTKSFLRDTDVVLDFGCASGEISLDVAQHVQRVYGIDTSIKMIELAKRKAHDRQADNVSFDQTDAFDQRLVTGSFSAVIAFNVFHLLDDAPRVLGRLNGLLTPGGLLISKTPCRGEWSWLIRSLIGLAQKLGLVPPILKLTVAELESLVSNGNFEILETSVWDKKSATQWVIARKM